jgi:homoserine O-succinyltransferase
MENQRKIRVAILDLYEGIPNQGMRCLREILHQYGDQRALDITTEEFEVRQENRLPGLDFDVYISSGGPGDPLESGDNDWGTNYFNWLRAAEHHKKQVLFICHSFQLACRYFAIADITRRKSTAFGVFPIHLEVDGMDEPVFSGLQDPFFAVDSRNYQVIRPDEGKLQQLGAHILAIEKERPHVDLERAVMAVRFNEHMIGTQFHPEADATGMSIHLQSEDKKKTVIAEHGEEKWRSMIEQLDDPEKIRWTYSHVIPNFLDMALRTLQHLAFAKKM